MLKTRIKQDMHSSSTSKQRRNQMNYLISTGLVMAGVFVVGYPLVLFVLNRIMIKLENENNAVKMAS